MLAHNIINVATVGFPARAAAALEVTWGSVSVLLLGELMWRGNVCPVGGVAFVIQE